MIHVLAHAKDHAGEISSLQKERQLLLVCLFVFFLLSRRVVFEDQTRNRSV